MNQELFYNYIFINRKDEFIVLLVLKRIIIHNNKVLLLIFAVYLVSFPLFAFDINGLISPSEDLSLHWNYIITDNFKIIFPEGYLNFSKYLAQIAEDVYKKLSNFSGYKPPARITILVSIFQDDPNGYVMPGPEGLYITVFPVTPYNEVSYNLDEYIDWYKTLLSHELAHVFHIDIREGFAGIFKSIFGDIFYPNGMTPVFYREGFATYYETLYNNIGRGNSPFTDMFIRASFYNNPLDGEIFIDRYSSRPHIWPYTMGCYLYGVSFLQFVSNRYGNGILERINKDSSCFPFVSFSSAFKRDTGKEIGKLWDEWLVFERNKAYKKINDIKEQSITEFRNVGISNGFVGSVVIDKEGRYIYYSLSDSSKYSGLYRYDLKKNKNILLKPNIYCSDIEILYDYKGRAEGLLYIRRDYENNFSRSNIYYFNLKGRREDKLTTGGFYRDITFIEKENLLVTKGNIWGTEIYIASFSVNKKYLKLGKRLRFDFDSDFYTFETPEVYKKANRIAFSVRDKEGNRFIAVGKINGDGSVSEIMRVTGLKSKAYSPKWIDNNKIAYISNQEGVYNIYVIDIKNKNIKRLTNLVTGVFDFDFTRTGDFAVKIYSSEGYYVGYAKSLLNNNFGIIKGVLAGLKIYKNTEQNFDNVLLKEYKASNYILPSFWLPFASGNGIILGTGFFTINRDYIGRFNYSFASVYDLFDKQFKVSSTGAYFYPDFDIFWSVYIDENYNFIPAFHVGIEKNIKKAYYLFGGKLGQVLEDNYSGIKLSVFYNSLKRSYKWMWPARGMVFSNSIYFNFTNRVFYIEEFYVSYNDVFFNELFFEVNNRLLTDFNGASGAIFIGRGNGYIYAPMNGIYALGYPKRVYGSLALKQEVKLTFPLISIERGFDIFPLYFNNILFLFGIESYQVGGIIPEGIGNIFKDIYESFKFSLKSEIVLNSTVFYDAGFRTSLGYVISPCRGGVGGFYMKFDISM